MISDVVLAIRGERATQRVQDTIAVFDAQPFDQTDGQQIARRGSDKDLVHFFEILRKDGLLMDGNAVDSNFIEKQFAGYARKASGG